MSLLHMSHPLKNMFGNNQSTRIVFFGNDRSDYFKVKVKFLKALNK